MRNRAIWMMLEIVSAAMKTPRSVVGWSVGSETATSVLLGVMWTLFFMVAWASRDDDTAEEPAPRVEPAAAVLPEAAEDAGLATAPQAAQPGR